MQSRQVIERKRPAKVSGRQVLGGGSALLIGASLDAPARAQRRGVPHYDICVVGAGYSDLTAALRLRQAGASVIVLEARNCIGERTLTAPVKGGGWIDLGDHWVGSDQNVHYGLIRKVGRKTYKSYDMTLERSTLDTKEFIRIGDELHDKHPGSDQIEAAYEKVDRLAETIDLDKPSAHADAAQLDAMTFAEWLRANVDNDNVRALFGGVAASVACASTLEIPVLEMAYLVHACHGLDKQFAFTGGAQQDRLIHGTQPIAQRVTDRFGKGSVRLDQPVRSIKWSDKSAVVRRDEFSIVARHIIVAIPPHLAAAIDYDPSPPTARVQVTQRWPQGLVIKVQIIYGEPYWRADGLNGASSDHLGVVGETADSSVPTKYSGKGIMIGFIYYLFRSGAQSGRAAGGQAPQAGAR